MCNLGDPHFKRIPQVIQAKEWSAEMTGYKPSDIIPRKSMRIGIVGTKNTAYMAKKLISCKH